MINKQHDAKGVGVGLLGSIAYEQVNCDGREQGSGVNMGNCSKAGESIPTLIWFIDICNFRSAETGQGLGKGSCADTGKGLG